jgi:taurine transport system substrate-binding protein
LGQGAVDFACGYGGGLARMKEFGNVLLTGDEKEALGILVFDVTSGPADYIAENSETVAKFLKVTADANAAWAADPSEELLAAIAQESGMDLEATRSSIGTMKFPTVEAQLSDAWFGGNAATFMKGVADVFVEAGSIDSALDDYSGTVNTGPLAAANEM